MRFKLGYDSTMEADCAQGCCGPAHGPELSLSFCWAGLSDFLLSDAAFGTLTIPPHPCVLWVYKHLAWIQKSQCGDQSFLS